MLAWLRMGGTLVLMTDLHSPRNGLKVDKLGRATRISRGSLRLVQASGSPISPVAHVHEEDGSFRLHCGPPMPLPPGPDGPQRLAQELCDWQEPRIHQYGEPYLLAYPRWRRGERARLREAVAPTPRVLNLVRG